MRSLFQLVIPGAADSPGSPIIVLALKDRKSFQSLEPEAYLAKGQLDLAGYFMRAPDKNYILLRLDAQGEHPFATVYHEYTHYMLRNASQWIPLWLNEGLAEFYQNTDIEEQAVLLGQASADDILYLRQNRLLALTTLLTVDQTSPYYHEEQKGSVFYAESWALTHYLEVTGRQQGKDYIHDYALHLVKKEDPVAAARESFGDLNQLQKALDRYISQGQFMMFKMNSVIAVDESSFQVQPVSSFDADAIRADVLVYNQRTKEAQALLDALLHDDPKNPQAHETMGYLKFREGDMEAARKWYGEAVRLDSQSYLAHYYYAAMSIGLPDAQNAEIESSLRTCMKLNPAFAPAYDALARLYFSDPAKRNEAHMLNLQAISLDPDNLTYRLNAASILENSQHSDNALNVLEAAKHVAKTPDDVAMVQARIDSIQRIQTAAAQRAQRESQEQSAAMSQPASTDVEDTRSMTITSSDGREHVLKPTSAGDMPKYPTEPLTRAHHTVNGVLRKVHCYYPSILVLEVDQPGKGVMTLYRNDFFQIAFTASNFTPKGDINPCTDLEEMKGRVEYSEVTDKSVGGQIISIELSK
ncbi:MAG TPA: DUF1570 domain-containing protein [Pseudacidobacterium sp.]|nr:DUF1570 domain-containing protein [Pseudacidobacterium sp.]